MGVGSDRRGWMAAWVVTSGLLLSRPSHAESVEDRVRFSLEGRVLDYRALTASSKGMEDVSVSQTTFGLASSSFGPGVGYGVSDSVVLGARVSFLSTERSWDGDVAPSATSKGLGLYGSLELVGGGDAVRPFAAPLLGYESSGIESGSAEVTSTATVFGVQAGLHAFAADSFSIDPSLMLTYATGSTKAGDLEVDESGIVFAIGFALSGWLGGDRAAAASPAAASPEGEAEAEERRDSTATPRAPVAPSTSPDELKVTLTLDGSGRMVLEVDPDGSVTHFRFITPADGPDQTCGRIALQHGNKEEAIGLEEAKVVAQGSSLVLVATGTASPAALSLAGKRRDAVVLVACDREYEVPEHARSQIRELAARAKRLRRETGAAAAAPATPAGAAAQPAAGSPAPATAPGAAPMPAPTTGTPPAPLP